MPLSQIAIRCRRNQRDESLGHGLVHLQGFEVAAVDADDLRAGFHGAPQLVFGPNFDDRLESQLSGGRQHSGQLVRWQSPRDQQDRGRMRRARLDEL